MMRKQRQASSPPFGLLHCENRDIMQASRMFRQLVSEELCIARFAGALECLCNVTIYRARSIWSPAASIDR